MNPAMALAAPSPWDSEKIATDLRIQFLSRLLSAAVLSESVICLAAAALLSQEQNLKVFIPHICLSQKKRKPLPNIEESEIIQAT
jgi:hypothetical protein